MKRLRFALASLTTLLATTVIAIAQVQPVVTPVQSGANDVAVPSDAVPVIDEVVETAAGHVVSPPERRIVLDGQVIFIQPPAPGWNTVPIQTGTKVTLSLGESFAGASAVTWWHDGVQLAATGSEPSWSISSLTAEHDGYYQARFVHDGTNKVSGEVRLKATPLQRAPLLNLSTKATLSSTSPSMTSGFVIDDAGLVPGQARYVLIRAIGPSLSDYGIDAPLPDPEFGLFHAGSGMGIGLAFPAIYYSDDTTPESRYYDWVRRVSAAVGAFPIPLYEQGQPRPPEDAMLIGLSPGAYTVTVKSRTGASGEVILEIYEVSTEIAKALEGDPPPPFDAVPVEPGS